MKKKIVLMSLMIVALFCTFAVSAFATEFTVTTTGEFDDAYSQAQDGDTIVISGDITADLKFGKSITYVLRANWQTSSWGEFSGGNTEISIIADGGNYKLQPTNYYSNGMLTQYSNVEGKYVLNLGGINGGTLTYDGTNVTNPRLMYVGGKLDLTWNLLNGARISGFNLTTSNSEVKARIIHATEFNMYEGSKICGNSIPANSAAFINSTALNIYGGEICHNYSQGNRNWNTDCGFIYVKGNVNMYGGKIYKNVINVDMNKSFYGFIDVTSGNTVAFFGGYIGENYASTSGNISAIFGVADENVTYCYFKNQEFGKTLKYSGGSVSLVDGKWVVSDATITEEQLTDPSFNWKGHKGSSDSVIAFFASDSLVVDGVSLSRYKAIEGYIQGVNLKDAWNNNQGTNKTYSLTGSDCGVPATSELWSTEENNCGIAIALDSSPANGYYFAVAHEYAQDDFNCETGDICTVCKAETNIKSHIFIENIIYENGFDKVGLYTCDCINEGCTALDTEKEHEALFTCLGYSTPKDGRGGLVIGFTVNNEAITEYEEVTGKTLKYGVFAVSKNKLGENDIINNDGTVASGVIKAEINIKVTAFDFILTGFETDAHKNAKLALGAYVAETDGETTKYFCLQYGAPEENEKYSFVSYNDILGNSSTGELK